MSNELLSLFCGAGGLDAGFEAADFAVPLAFDIRESSIASYNANRKHASGYARDITKLKIAHLDKLYGGTFKPIGIIGGPPCQGFSVSNVNKRDDDERNDLSLSYSRLLSALNKRNPVHFFMFENVKGLLGKKHSEIYEKILKRFKNAGFNIFIAKVNAQNYNVPQSRERLVIIGLNKDLYPNAVWEQPVPSTKGKPRTVRQTIEKLGDPIYFAASGDIVKNSVHPNHWCMTPKSKKFFTKGALIEGQSYGRSFRTIVWDKPSPTVAYGNREVHVHPDGKRRLSIYEAMLLQGFPKNYILEGTLSQQITQVSEAVPPPLAKEIALSIKRLLALPIERKKTA